MVDDRRPGDLPEPDTAGDPVTVRYNSRSATLTVPETGEERPTLIQRVMQLRPVRAGQRYGKAMGGMLAGGIAYSAIFSLVAALTIAWTVFMATLGGNPALRGDVVDAVNTAMPGLLDDGSGDGLVPTESLVLDTALNPASVIAALVLLWTAVSLMTNIRRAIQAMFGIVAPPENFVLQKLRDLLGFLLMAVLIVASSVLGTAAGTLGSQITEWIGLGESPIVSVLLRAAGFLVAAGVSMLTWIQLFRLTAAVRPPRKDLLLGAAVGGIVVQIVLTLGTSLVSSVSDDPLLGAAAGLATLLLWINLLSRILLLVAAFTANPPAPEMPETKEEVHFQETPNYVTLSAPHTLDWSHQDVTGQLDPDPSLRAEDEDTAHAREYAERRAERTADNLGEPQFVSEIGKDGEPLPQRRYGGAIGAAQVARAERLERKAVEARAALGQRSRLAEAEEGYYAEKHDKRRTEARARDGYRTAMGSTLVTEPADLDEPFGRRPTLGG